jgi:HKD family nuclease
MSKRRPNQFEIIENAGPNSLLGNLKRVLKRADRADIAVAFISVSGLNELLPSLQQIAAHGSVRILTGLYQSITDPQALRILLRAEEQSRGRLSTRISKEPKFHRKIYLARAGGQVRAIIGSSNLTKDGLSSGGELNVYLSSAANSAPMRRLSNMFDAAWEGRAVSLNKGLIDRYVRLGSFNQQKNLKHSVPLRKIIGSSTVNRSAKIEKQEGSVSYWRDYIQGYACKQTEALIASTTNWDARGYRWYSSGPHLYEKKDRLLLFDFTVNRIQVAQVVDWTRTTVRTPEGVHFVAFKPVRGIKVRHITGQRWDSLKHVLGISGKAEVYTRRKISPCRWKEIMAVIH